MLLPLVRLHSLAGLTACRADAADVVWRWNLLPHLLTPMHLARAEIKTETTWLRRRQRRRASSMRSCSAGSQRVRPHALIHGHLVLRPNLSGVHEPLLLLYLRTEVPEVSSHVSTGTDPTSSTWTEATIGTNKFAGATVINGGRGAHMVEADVLAALDSGQVWDADMQLRVLPRALHPEAAPCHPTQCSAKAPNDARFRSTDAHSLDAAAESGDGCHVAGAAARVLPIVGPSKCAPGLLAYPSLCSLPDRL